MNDPVNHPEHYTSLDAFCDYCHRRIETIWVTRAMNFDRGNAVKYIWRAGSKGPEIEDLRKAIFYLKDEIKRLGGEP